MKKPNFDIKKKSKIANKSTNYRYNKTPSIESFSVEKINQFSDELIELFKLIQAVKHDRVNLQEEYNQYRLKLNNDRMNLESEVIKIKKHYNSKISSLQEEYNSVKSNSVIELTKVREN
ncbi:hypothetical protein fh0823_00770 [Francisella halioticida]|uniref:Uncharacterized protein n=1 Tax=Francisella halioticida TaxID=549298 RepID=A0ABM6LY80_9GAMM|nr:hypothetical protein [Francisella halioticida]ASG67473.1 hypothetical protein CDV26_02830 [Francisella halioticida]BCD89938.1 hypothetical protein fh0823_00770 [Francisella halioticida]